jgi:dolichyl-phosphate beta-glucosyltransferase
MSVVVPVFNEEAEIATIVPAVRAALQARGGDWEILVIDNASTDGTSARVAAFQDSAVRLVRNEVNRGKGYSVRRGMLEAHGDLRLMCDADCAASLASLARMEALIGEADVIAGLRNAPDSRVGRHQPLRRRAASLGFIFLCRAVMAEPLRDVFCGFKLFTGAAAEDVDGWAFDAEALALARALGYRVRGCGIEWVNRPASRLSIPRVVIPVLCELVATRLHLHRHRPQPGVGAGARPVRDAGPGG